MRKLADAQLILLLVVVFCLASTIVAQEPQSHFKVDGAATVIPLCIEAMDQFTDAHKDPRIQIQISGAQGGFQKFVNGEAAIWGSLSPISNEQLTQCRAKGIRFIELPVAYSSLVIVVDKQNTFVDQLNTKQLRKIFTEDGGAGRWDDIQDDWPEENIELFVPGTDSSTFDYFRELVMEPEDQLRIDATLPQDDRSIVGHFSIPEQGIGFLGAAYYFENTDRLRAVPIINQVGNPTEPTEDSIQTAAYPFSRPLFIYVNALAADDPEFTTFVEYYLKNVSDLATNVGYVPLPEEINRRTLHHFNRRLTGSHFLTAKGEVRTGNLDELYTEDSRIE